MTAPDRLIDGLSRVAGRAPPETPTFERSVEVGGPWVLSALWNRLGLSRCLRGLTRADAKLDLDALARGVTEEWVVRAMAKNIDLGYEECGCRLMINGVPLLLRELLTNLVDNAIKYTPSGGHVTVRACADRLAIIEVEDDGIGIPVEERESIFERFYRVLGTDAEGSGLGLPIAAEIAELHQARIDLLEGSGGRGSLFRVSFPRHRDPKENVAPPIKPGASDFPIGL